MSFEGGVAKIYFGKLRGRKMPPYTVVVCPTPKTALEEEVKKVQHPISDR
jgi:hypothetical protein